MTINELITKVRAEKPNSFTDVQLYSFINQIEYEVAEQLGTVHRAYTWTSAQVNDGAEILDARPPYDRLYVSWMKAQIDYAHEEYESFENNQAQHVADFQDFTDWVVREDADNLDPPTRFTNVF